MISSFWLIYKKKFNSRNQYPDSVSYDKLTKILKSVTEKHATLKKQKVPENGTPFMTKQLGKQVIKDTFIGHPG